MARLTDTYNLTKRRSLAVTDGLSFIEVSVIGDGNCAMYGFASGVVDKIQCDEFNLSRDQYAEILRAMTASLVLLKERLKLYRNLPSTLHGNVYGDLAAPLETVIRFIESKPHVNQFTDFIKTQTTRLEIAALQVAFGPALRSLALEKYATVLNAAFADKEKTDNAEEHVPELLDDLQTLAHDGVPIGQELIAQLARDFFGFNVHIYTELQEGGLRRVDLTPDIQAAPTFSMVHVPDASDANYDHWNYLLPKEQQNGLAHLPDSTELTADIVGGLEADYEQLAEQTEISKEELYDISDTLHSLSESLLGSEKAEEQRDLLDNLALQSSRIVHEAREKLHVSNEKLNALGLSKLAKKLVMDTVLPTASLPASTDEALARSLQNAEIASFLSRNYAALSSRSSSASHPAVNRSENEQDARESVDKHHSRPPTNKF